jgi:mRNA-degrading endonuclease RelE of RelBE toxin-antitoxin system
VELSKRAIKDLASIPDHVAVKLQDWVEDVEDRLAYYRIVGAVVEFVQVEGVDKHEY